MLTQKNKPATSLTASRRLSTADEVEVLFSGGRFALTRFANNTIHQNVAEENHVCLGAHCIRRDARRGLLPISLTTKVCGRSCARRRAWRRCSIRIRISCRCRIHAKLPAVATGESPVARREMAPSRHFETTAAITPELRAEGVKKIVGVARQHKLTTAGVFSSAESVEGIFNSRGLSNWHTQTSAEVSITMLAPDSSGWQKGEFAGRGATSIR